jgi:hypothetical protein
MEDTVRWTIRGVAEDARLAVDEVHEVTGVPYGRLVTDAIRIWYSGLEEEDPMPVVKRKL